MTSVEYERMNLQVNRREYFSTYRAANRGATFAFVLL